MGVGVDSYKLIREAQVKTLGRWQETGINVSCCFVFCFCYFEINHLLGAASVPMIDLLGPGADYETELTVYLMFHGLSTVSHHP